MVFFGGGVSINIQFVYSHVSSSDIADKYINNNE